MEKKRLLALLAGVFVIILTMPLCGMCATPPSTSQPTLSLKFSSPWFESNIWSKPGKLFAERITQATGGRISFQTFYGGTMTKPMETLDAVQHRVVDVCVSTSLYAPGKLLLPDFDFSFWFSTPDMSTRSKVKREMYSRIPAFNNELAKFNVGPRILFGANPTNEILSRKPIKNLEDLKGKRISFMGTAAVPAFTAVGAIPVMAPATEYYERLERGVIDAVFLPLNNCYAFKLYEVAKHFTSGGLLGTCPVEIWINMDVWKGLKPEDQKLFIDIGKEGDALQISEGNKELEAGREAFKKAGVTFYTLPAADIKKWADTMPDIVADWAKKMEAAGLPGWNIVDTYNKLMKEAGWQFPRQWGVR